MTDHKFNEREIQEECERIVRDGVICLSNHYVQLLQEQEDGAFWDDLENFYKEVCSECQGDDLEEYDSEDDPEYDEEQEGSHVCGLKCSYCGHVNDPDSPDTEAKEVFEWWRVDGFLAERLRAQEAVMLETEDGTIWGRETTGQAISMDGVIRRIAIAILQWRADGYPAN